MAYDHIVTTPLAPILLKPEPDSELADEALYGMMLKVIDEKRNYAYVQMEYGYEGWILKEDISPDRGGVWQEKRNALIQSPFAEVLPAQRYQDIPMIKLPRGSVIIKVSEITDNQDWIKVMIHDGSLGYCRKEWLRAFSEFPEKDDEAQVRDSVTKDALAYMGTHYKWGGKSPAGIDCSGLTFMSYWMNGITIYRDAVIKYGYPVEEISEEDSKKGDLLYFPGHIAMYLGEGRYVHSTGSQGGVVLNSLDPDSEKFLKKNLDELNAWGSIYK